MSACDPAGRELWTWVWPLPGANRYREASDTPARNKAKAKESAERIEIKAGDLIVHISKQTGLLAGAQRGTHTFSLANGPRPAAGSARLLRLETKSDASDQVVVATFDGDLKQVVWRVRGNGWVQCDYTYAAEGPKDFHGVAFDYPETLVKRKRWLGNGPYRVWKNRLRGVTLNVWANDYNNTITGWRDWAYPEFKGCFAGVRWMQLETTEGLLTAIPEPGDSFVQVLTPDLPPTNLVGKTAVQLPRAGLAFLHAIPPIGSKFKDASTSGPQGQLTIAAGEYHGSVSFYFGNLK